MNLSSIDRFVKHGKRLFQDTVIDLDELDDDPTPISTTEQLDIKYEDSSNSYEPYYVDSFTEIVTHVRDEPIFLDILSEDEKKFIDCFLVTLDSDCKRFLLRMYGRKKILFERKQFDQMKTIIERDQHVWIQALHDSSLLRNDIPFYLQRFTLPRYCFSLLSKSLEVFERLRLYEEAGNLIESIFFLDATKHNVDNDLLRLIGPKKVGRLVSRYVQDVGFHQRNSDLVHKLIETLSPDLRSGFKFALAADLDRMERAAKEGGFEEERTSEYLEPKKIELKAKVKSSNLGSKRPIYVFEETMQVKMEEAGEAIKPSKITKLLRVENLVIHYFQQTSPVCFECALHCESSLYLLIYSVLFYDIIFSQDIPDVFYSKRQTGPLDLYTDCFYENRKEAIDARLKQISSQDEADRQFLEQHVKSIWTEHKDERALATNWDLVPDHDSFMLICECMGGRLVEAVCANLAKDYINWRAGLPDLFLWSPARKECCIIEVKGPNDKLSDQQRAWIDCLLKVDAPVYLCNVTAVPEKHFSNMGDDSVVLLNPLPF
ncbi:Fanconi-associated nuclease 1 [Cichlidogyrus casuarinus]|uniref:Fanconi-associated nuclease n=1 Tax=Cichlidogyrus casuarinus TaxID=1844966 RepID=A0ABD2PX95_9PLAT